MRKEGRELSGALAEHLIGSHTELTFEGCRSISLEMKRETDLEKERKRERDWVCSRHSAAFINGSVYPFAVRSLISVISTHQSPPPPHTVPWPLAVYLPSPERRDGKDGDESNEKEYSQWLTQGALNEHARHGKRDERI